MAQRWLEQGDAVHVMTRSASRAKLLSDNGLRPLVGDLTNLDSLPALPAVDTLLFAVGWDRSAGKTIQEVYVGGLEHLLTKLPSSVGRVVYISSTGVYGQTSGERVDETSVCRPQREGGRACLAAEQVLAQHAMAERTVILRLAGIYGPGRLPRQADLIAGRPIAVSADGLINLIHVDDAVQAVLAASELELTLPRWYTVSDGHPVARGDFYHELARLLGTEAPRYVDPPTATRTRGSTSKRVANGRMVAELRVQLQYPTYQDGLAAITALS